MKAVISVKDVCRVESFLGTDVASFSLWGSEEEGKHIDIDTGTDGNFKIIVNFNQNIPAEEQGLVHKFEKGITLKVDGCLYLGSKEWMNEGVLESFQKNLVDSIELTPGNYVVDAYSLSIKDPAGKPKYIQFMICIFPEGKYVAGDSQLHTANQPVVLKY